MTTAHELYTNQIRHLPLAERLRLAALLLDDLQEIRLLLPDADSPVVKERPRPKRGSGKADISYIAPDFDAPLEEMREYSE